MARTMWFDIKENIADDIANGRLVHGDRLPTEPELAARFKAGRHSVRRAIESLVKEGKLNVKQGSGTFVEIEPVLVYTIGKRTRLHRNLLPQGYEVTSELLSGEMIEAPAKICKKLQLEAGAQVVASTRRVLANATPISFGTVYHPASRFPDFVERARPNWIDDQSLCVLWNNGLRARLDRIVRAARFARRIKDVAPAP